MRSTRVMVLFLILVGSVGCAEAPGKGSVGATATARPSSPPVTPSARPLPPAAASDAGEHWVAIVTPVTTDVDLYGLLELEIQTDLSPANPYDPSQLDVRVRFTSPAGGEVDVGAFWYQDFDLHTYRRTGDPGWRVRFTPTEVGTWTASAHVQGLDIPSDPVPFHVRPSNRPGFIRIDSTHPRSFAFDNGDPFFPIGLNLGWWQGHSDALTDYRTWLGLLAARGGNAIRVWMAPWAFSIEWNDTGLGDYAHRMDAAWQLHQVFRMAEAQGVYVILVLLNHGQFSEWVNPEWKDNPYNAKQGGPLDSPEQFATDPAARALFQQRLTYIVNRWGYSPNLLAWEWWNEVNLTPITTEMLIPWIQEMTAHLHAQDVNRHLTTISLALRGPSPIWDLPELHIIQRHEYADQVAAVNRDAADLSSQGYLELVESAPPKPILLGEFGYSAANNGDDADKTGIHLHNGLWGTTFSGYAGSGMYWYWDNYVAAYNLWYHFQGLAAFLDGVDLRTYRPVSPLELAAPNGAPPRATGMGLRGEDVLVWLRNQDYTTQASAEALAREQRGGGSAAFSFDPPWVQNVTLTVEGMPEGTYTVHWFDPQRARWLEEAAVSAHDGALVIQVPSFHFDLAARIVPNP